MDYVREIEDLKKRINYLDRLIELNKEFGNSNDYKENESKRECEALAELLEKFQALDSKAFDIPSKTMTPSIRIIGNEVVVEFVFVSELLSDLYRYVCDSYSEWHIQHNHMLEYMFYNTYAIPKLTIKLEHTYYNTKTIKERCDIFYTNVLEFIKFLNGHFGKAILNSIDTYYLSLIEEAKKDQEEEW